MAEEKNILAGLKSRITRLTNAIKKLEDKKHSNEAHTKERIDIANKKMKSELLEYSKIKSLFKKLDVDNEYFPMLKLYILVVLIMTAFFFFPHFPFTLLHWIGMIVGVAAIMKGISVIAKYKTKKEIIFEAEILSLGITMKDLKKKKGQEQSKKKVTDIIKRICLDNEYNCDAITKLANVKQSEIDTIIAETQTTLDIATRKYQEAACLTTTGQVSTSTLSQPLEGTTFQDRMNAATSALIKENPEVVAALGRGLYPKDDKHPGTAGKE